MLPTTLFQYTNVQLLSSITNHIENTFKTHGAIQLTSPSFLPIAKLNQIYSKETVHQYVKYLDTKGNIFTLPNNLITGFARYVSLLHIENSCRYEVSFVLYII